MMTKDDTGSGKAAMALADAPQNLPGILVTSRANESSDQIDN